MPTGYTAAIEDGRITTLRDFALLCTRAMGVAITMRDDPFDAPLPERFEPQTKYHDERLAEATKTLAECQLMSDDECEKRASQEYQSALDSHQQRQRERAEVAGRYDAIQQEIDRWLVPEQLSSLRDFMIQQIAESRRFLGGEPEPFRMSSSQWRAAKVKSARMDLEYHTKGRAEEIARTKGRNHWLALLRDCLPEDDADD